MSKTLIKTGSFKKGMRLALCITALIGASHAAAFTGSQDVRIDAYDAVSVTALTATLHVGDVVFIRVPAKPFREVATATGSWTNHVGIVVDSGGEQTLVAESAFPFSRITALSDFAVRSEHGRIPWERETVTPASVLRSPALRLVFDGGVMRARTPCRTRYMSGEHVHQHADGADRRCRGWG